MRIVVERVAGDREDVELVYEGRVETSDRAHRLVVRVAESEGSPDGLSAEAEIEGADVPDGLPRQVASMVRSAVRTARKDGRPPPRRIQRWRG